MQQRVGVVGAGRMGSRMVRRLLGAGHAVTVHDPALDARRLVEREGAHTAELPAEVAVGAGFVLCSLPTPEIAEAALTGPGGVLEGIEPGAVVIDLGTGDPDSARRMAAACERAGADFLDAPVSRGVAAAEAGTLAMLVGGDERTLERARPLLEQLASDIFRVGDVGAGQVTKLCNNMLAAIVAASLGEVLVAGVRAGVELEPLARAVAASSGGSHVLESYLPRGLFTEDRPAGFTLALMRKDIGLFLRTGADMDLSLPISDLVCRLYATAGDDGLADADWTSVAELYERSAGVRLQLAETSELPA